MVETQENWIFHSEYDKYFEVVSFLCHDKECHLKGYNSGMNEIFGIWDIEVDD